MPLKEHGPHMLHLQTITSFYLLATLMSSAPQNHCGSGAVGLSAAVTCHPPFLFLTVYVVPKMGPPGGPIFGPCLGSFFKVFCIRVAEVQCFGFLVTLWLVATGRATVHQPHHDLDRLLEPTSMDLHWQDNTGIPLSSIMSTA